MSRGLKFLAMAHLNQTVKLASQSCLRMRIFQIHGDKKTHLAPCTQKLLEFYFIFILFLHYVSNLLATYHSIWFSRSSIIPLFSYNYRSVSLPLQCTAFPSHHPDYKLWSTGCSDQQFSDTPYIRRHFGRKSLRPDTQGERDISCRKAISQSLGFFYWFLQCFTPVKM